MDWKRVWPIGLFFCDIILAIHTHSTQSISNPTLILLHHLALLYISISSSPPNLIRTYVEHSTYCLLGHKQPKLLPSSSSRETSKLPQEIKGHQSWENAITWGQCNSPSNLLSSLITWWIFRDSQLYSSKISDKGTAKFPWNNQKTLRSTNYHRDRLYFKSSTFLFFHG